MNKRHVLIAAVLFAAPAWAEDPAKPETSQNQQPSQTTPADNAQTAGTKQQAKVAVSEADARRVLSQSAAAASTKGQLQSLNQQFAQADQQRIGDLSQQGQQLDQSISQLNQAYKDKFQKDLDLSQNTDQVFTALLFRVGGDAADEARQAAAKQAPDNATDADPAAGAAVTEQAQTPAGTSGGDHAVIIIPKQQDMPAARIALIQEGGQWKIDLPDSVDAKQLTQKLQQNVDQAVQQKDQWGANADEAQRAIARQILIVFAEPADKAAATDAAPGRSDSSPGTAAPATPNQPAPQR